MVYRTQRSDQHVTVCHPAPPLLCASALMFVQDFIQVLSMFANFGFDWPPAIRGIFNVFSLVNFNFELLAPECSFTINFETKWYGSYGTVF